MVRLMKFITASRTNYGLSYAFDFACPVVMGYLGSRHALAWPFALACFFAGALVFSFVEYAMHRWFFHAPRRLAATLHGAHHAHPNEPHALPFFSSAGVALIGWQLLSLLIDAPVACFFLSGLLAAYFYYAVLHHLQHSIRIKSVRWAWLQKRWTAHAIHHGRLDTNFGVTTSFWDNVFRTHYLPRKACSLSRASDAARVSAASGP